MTGADLDKIGVLTPEQYQAEIIKADNERAREALWLALCEARPEPMEFQSSKAFKEWCEHVNKLVRQKFEMLQ